MKLQGRNLELNLRGEDVKLLQQELKQLEFQAVQPSGFFDSVTFAAVQNFQIQAAIPEILRRLQEQVVRLALRPAEPDRPTLACCWTLSTCKPSINNASSPTICSMRVPSTSLGFDYAVTGTSATRP